MQRSACRASAHRLLHDAKHIASGLNIIASLRCQVAKRADP